MEAPLDPSDLRRDFAEAALAQGFESHPISEKLGIPAYTRKGSGPTVLLSAGIHGDEPAAVLAALAFLRQGPSRDFNWLLTPILNPSGLAKGTRENADGIDLNRDYGSGITFEVAAHLKWLQKQPTPDVFIALHEDYDGTGFYFYEIRLDGQPALGESLITKVEEKITIEPGPIIDEREATGPGYFFFTEIPSEEERPDGLPEAIHLSLRGCPLSLTFETPTHEAPMQQRIDAHLVAIEATLEHFRKI
jgi:hypothetical protein